jgi:benzoylformate decarboxylase
MAAGTRTASGAATAIFATLRAWGVDRVFICPGSTEAAFLDASLDEPDVELIATTDEAITVSMADGHARATGRPAIAYVHTHLGLANGVAHLSCARLERSPVVVLAGLKASTLHGAAPGFTTTSDVGALARQFVKWAHETTTPETVGRDLDHALRVAATAPMGPAFLGIHQEQMETELEVSARTGPPAAALGRVRPDPHAVDTAAALLSEAARPLVVAGADVFRAGAASAVDALAARLGAPVVVEDRRTIERAETAEIAGFAGVLDGRSALLREADAVLLAGARAPIRFEHHAPPVLPATLYVAHLSEDPRELALGPPGALELLGDVRHGLADLVAALPNGSGADRGFREQAVAAHLDHMRRTRDEAERDAELVPIRVPSLMRRLCAALEPGTWVVDDAVTSKAALLDHATAPEAGLRYLTTAGGSLGWGLGAALGVADARAGERVVAVLGDGVFQFGVAGLWTAVDRALPVIFVVVNNQGYGAVKAALRRYDGEAVARGEYPITSLDGPDIAAIARGFGAAGTRVERLDEFDAALAVAHERSQPTVIEVLTDPDDSGPLR